MFVGAHLLHRADEGGALRVQDLSKPFKRPLYSRVKAFTLNTLEFNDYEYVATGC